MNDTLDLMKVIEKLKERVSELTYQNIINTTQIEQLIELVNSKDATLAELREALEEANSKREVVEAEIIG
jgi:hypothetical protein